MNGGGNVLKPFDPDNGKSNALELRLECDIAGHQHQRDFVYRPRLVFRRDLRRVDLKPERAAFPDRALKPHPAAQQVDELLGDSETKTGAAIFVEYGGIGLRETLEDAALRLRRNADPSVADLKAQPNAVGLLLDAVDGDDDKTTFRELDGVCGEVDQNLLDVIVVHQDMRRRAAGNMHAKGQTLRRRLHGEHRLQPPYRLVKINLRDRARHAAGLDARVVEDAID